MIAAVNTGHIRSTLSSGNSAMNGALGAAMGALHLLNDAGCVVVEIKLRGGRPTLVIDQPPTFVHGAAKITRTHRGMRDTIYAAPFHGVQLEWVMPRQERVA